MDIPRRPPDDTAAQPRAGVGGLAGADVDGMADVEPLDVTGVRTVTVGTLLFLLAAVVLALCHDSLEDSGREWWLWTCVAGFGLGLFGCMYCRRRARQGIPPGSG